MEDRPRAPTARRPILEEGGYPPQRHRARQAHGIPEREGGESLNQEEEEGAPPGQCALPSHGIQGRREAPNLEEATGGPPEQRALPAHGMQTQEGGGPYQGAEEGTPPEQCVLPVQGM